MKFYTVVVRDSMTLANKYRVFNSFQFKLVQKRICLAILYFFLSGDTYLVVFAICTFIYGEYVFFDSFYLVSCKDI